MKEKSFVLIVLLVLLWSALLAGLAVCRVVFPAAILPGFDVPLLLGVSLAALAAEHGLAPGARRPWGMTALLAGLTFGLLPLCAGLAGEGECVKLSVLGAAILLLCAVLFDAMVQRLSSGPAPKAAPVAAAFVLFLAGQAFTSIFF